MSVFITKLIKGLTTIKREGFVNGGKRVSEATITIFKKVDSGDILFITGGMGDNALYRTIHYSEELEINGFKCSVVTQDSPLLTRYADKFKVFIFHRVFYTPKVKKLINLIKVFEHEIVFETDDLVFDPYYLKYMDYFQNMNRFEKKLYQNGVGREILLDPSVKVCTTTTSYLADKLRKYNKKVFVVSNKLSNKDLDDINKISKNHKQKSNSVRIGYFSGTISHNRDFATITKALSFIMAKYQKVELFLVGPLEVTNELFKFKDRVRQVPRVVREKHFENIKKVDINLAPLEINNPFCEAKSELKFFEAGALGVPSVVAATQTFREAINDNVDGLLAQNTGEWIKKIEILINNKNLRYEMGQKAKEKAIEKYTNKNSNNVPYYKYLQSIY